MGFFVQRRCLTVQRHGGCFLPSDSLRYPAIFLGHELSPTSHCLESDIAAEFPLLVTNGPTTAQHLHATAYRWSRRPDLNRLIAIMLQLGGLQRNRLQRQDATGVCCNLPSALGSESSLSEHNKYCSNPPLVWVSSVSCSCSDMILKVFIPHARTRCSTFAPRRIHLSCYCTTAWSQSLSLSHRASTISKSSARSIV